MAFNPLLQLDGNTMALKIALDFKPGTKISRNEALILEAYAGFGGIKAILFPYGPIEEWRKLNASQGDLKLHKPMMQLHDLLRQKLSASDYEKALAEARHSVLTAFYTPSIVPVSLYQSFRSLGMEPQYLYEPSAGAGAFITPAVRMLPSLKQVTAVEKDLLTAKVLTALGASFSIDTQISHSGFENTSMKENSRFDFIVSNIPFGNFSVYDEQIKEGFLKSRIHNYFFAKALDKLGEGGLLAFLSTDAFLNSAGNRGVREYVLGKADLISVVALPDNLMSEKAGVEAPSHFIILQKRSDKIRLSAEEQSLVETVERKSEFGNYALNAYLSNRTNLFLGDQQQPGKNQYGKAHLGLRQDADMEKIVAPLMKIWEKDLLSNFNREAFRKLQAGLSSDRIKPRQDLTFLEMPVARNLSSSVQLGLFDTAPVTASNRALDYLSDLDECQIRKESVKQVATIRNPLVPGHENMLILASIPKDSRFYLYKIFSNIAEVQGSQKWLRSMAFNEVLQSVIECLKKYPYDFFMEGDEHLKARFNAPGASSSSRLTGLKFFYTAGTLVEFGNKVGLLENVDPQKDQAEFISLEKQNHTDFYKTYLRTRDAYFNLLEAERINSPDTESFREALKGNYKQMLDAYGNINRTDNARLISADKAHGTMILASLERKEGAQYQPADILSGRLKAVSVPFETNNPLEALARCLNEKGRVDLSFLQKVTKQEEGRLLEDLKGRIYLNPESNKWETAEQYLSGNVVQKLKVAEQANLNSPSPYIAESLEAIKNVQPEKVPFELLDFNLGERWIPLDYYNRFASAFFELDISISYFSSLDTFKVKASGSNAKLNREFAITPKSGRTVYGNGLLEHALENTSPHFTYEISTVDGKNIRLPDNDAIQLAFTKIESVRNAFIEWLGHLEIKDKEYLEKLYNETFNCYVLREYDGSHLSFPGLNRVNLGIEDLYSSQKNAAWRIIQNRGALIDHEVGLGKTLTMIVAAMEMKRLGIANKPMILALKANVNQIAETFAKAYPHSRILAPGEKDFVPAQRLRLFHEIKNNNWDCIILTHDQFGKIPQSPEIQQRIFQDELDNVERDLDTLGEMGGEVSRRMLKGLEIRKNNLENKLKGVVSNIEEKKDYGINFQDMGVDHLFVDESHKFKNLTFTTRHERVAGLGNLAGSQKALNMLFAVRTLQDKFNSDLCVTFLSGTPISNSLTEMYLLFKYLRPKEMERQCIENFDGWAAVYARKTTDFEFSVTNEIIAKERFRHFIKVPELALFYNEITDYKTAKHINLDKPLMDEHLVNIKPTPEQSEFIKKLMAFARNGDGRLIGRGKLSPEEDKGRMLIATNYAKKMAADMRLIHPGRYGDHPENKVNTCARNVAEIYRKSDEHQGTQIIFSDIGTPKLAEFNLYDALKRKLVEDLGIPSAEITFIHDWTDKQKPELFRRMNSGEIRILIGSTEKAGTGLNVQKRVVAMHHLDVPWKPSELEQREGRGARQGNWLAKTHYNNVVLNFIYAVEQSLDNYKFNLLRNKQIFISQMKNNALNVRRIDEGALDEQSGMNFAEYVAILSGDTSLLEKSKLEKKVAVLESLKTAHFREIFLHRVELKNLIQTGQEDSKILDKLREDQRRYQSHLQYDNEGNRLNSIKLNNIRSADPAEMGKYLLELFRSWLPVNEKEQQIGSLYGFDLYIRQQQYWDSKEKLQYYNGFYARSVEDIKYTWNDGQPNMDNPKLAARYFLNAIDRVNDLVAKYEKDLEKLNKAIPELETLIAKPFPQDQELSRLKSELSRLEMEITMKIKEKRLQETSSPGVEEVPAPNLANTWQPAYPVPVNLSHSALKR